MKSIHKQTPYHQVAAQSAYSVHFGHIAIRGYFITSLTNRCRRGAVACGLKIRRATDGTRLNLVVNHYTTTNPKIVQDSTNQEDFLLIKGKSQCVGRPSHCSKRLLPLLYRMLTRKRLASEQHYRTVLLCDPF